MRLKNEFVHFKKKKKKKYGRDNKLLAVFKCFGKLLMKFRECEMKEILWGMWSHLLSAVHVMVDLKVLRKIEMGGNTLGSRIERFRQV